MTKIGTYHRAIYRFTPGYFTFMQESKITGRGNKCWTKRQIEGRNANKLC